MSKKNILVVGGAGFIGSHVNKMLDQNGYKTLVLDNLSTGNRKAVTRGEFIDGDICNSAILDEIFTKTPINAVMHFAAHIDVGESMVKPSKYYHNNVTNTLTLLDAMRRHDVGIFIFSSSASIFGLPQEDKIAENHPTHPINPYGSTKLMVERILADFDRAYGLRSSCLRYFNAAGGDPDEEVKNFKTKESNLIPVVLRSLKESKEIIINGSDYPTPDGTCIRDYVHICDLGDAHILAMEQLFAGGPSDRYNLGNSQGFSVKEVLAAAEKVTGISPKITMGPRRAGDPPILIASSVKAQTKLGWKPRYPQLETIIEHAWKAL